MHEVTAKQQSWITLVVAILLTAFYMGASWYLLQRFALDKPLPETAWQRALILYNGIASVGFAAIGVLLGTTVQQTHVASARQDAADAKADAAQKSKVIKGALDKLTSDVSGKPGDLGGGPASEDSRNAEARHILLGGLS